jgi:hypothetical protein
MRYIDFNVPILSALNTALYHYLEQQSRLKSLWLTVLTHRKTVIAYRQSAYIALNPYLNNNHVLLDRAISFSKNLTKIQIW